MPKTDTKAKTKTKQQAASHGTTAFYLNFKSEDSAGVRLHISLMLPANLGEEFQSGGEQQGSPGFLRVWLPVARRPGRPPSHCQQRDTYCVPTLVPSHSRRPGLKLMLSFHPSNVCFPYTSLHTNGTQGFIPPMQAAP